MVKELQKLAAVKRVLWQILFLNWLVASAKLGYGLWSGALSMAASGFESILDGFNNVVGLIGIGIASQPPDAGHPYGHRKFETLATMGISLFLFLAGYKIVRDALHRFQSGSPPEVTVFSFGVMAFSMALSLFVTLYEQRKGRELQSSFLLADALHTRTDIYASLLVVISLIAAKLGYPTMDIVGALVIVGFIIVAAYRIIADCLQILADASRIPPGAIEPLALEVKGVRGCHHIRSRGLPDDVHVDLHLLVDPALDAQEAHCLAHRVEEVIRQRLKGVTDVVVHIEPEGAGCKGGDPDESPESEGCDEPSRDHGPSRDPHR